MEVSFVARLKTSVPNLAVIETDAGQCIGTLEPVIEEHARDYTLLERVCEWHNRAIGFYANRRKWLPHSTAEWLTNSVIPSDCRLLFFVQDESGTRIGLCGLSKIGREQAEIYDILRGEPGGHSLLFPYAQIAMLRLCFDGMALHTVVGASHRENVSARRMGRFVGFEEFGHRTGCQHDGERTDMDAQSKPADQSPQVLLRVTRDRLLERHPMLSGLPELRNSPVAVGGR